VWPPVAAAGWPVPVHRRRKRVSDDPLTSSSSGGDGLIGVNAAPPRPHTPPPLLPLWPMPLPTTWTQGTPTCPGPLTPVLGHLAAYGVRVE